MKYIGAIGHSGPFAGQVADALAPAAIITPPVTPETTDVKREASEDCFAASRTVGPGAVGAGAVGTVAEAPELSNPGPDPFCRTPFGLAGVTDVGVAVGVAVDVAVAVAVISTLC